MKVPLQKASAGWLTMQIKKFGLHEVDEIPLHTYAEAARLDTFGIHAGDTDGLLKGTRLDQVASLEFSGIEFKPDALTRANQQDELKVTTADVTAKTKLRPGDSIVAHVILKDGRILDLKSEVDAQRPAVNILTKSIQLDPSAPPAVRLGSQEELPQDGHLSFFLKTQVPETFPASEKIEVATADESFRVLLSFKDGNLTMQDAKTVLAVLDPMKLLGPSAFGPLKIRPVSGDGINGDWQPLVNLVRIPNAESRSLRARAGKAMHAERRQALPARFGQRRCRLSSNRSESRKASSKTRWRSRLRKARRSTSSCGMIRQRSIRSLCRYRNRNHSARHHE